MRNGTPKTQVKKAPTVDDLKREWGADFDAKLAAAQAVVQEHPDLVDALEETGAGNDIRIVRFFAQLAEELGVSASDEDVEAMSGADAKAAIARIMGNKKHPYFHGDKRAVERVAKLHERAYPGSTAA